MSLIDKINKAIFKSVEDGYNLIDQRPERGGEMIFCATPSTALYIISVILDVINTERKEESVAFTVSLLSKDHNAITIHEA